MTTHGERIRRQQLQYRLLDNLALLPSLFWLRAIFWLALGGALLCWLPYAKFDRADALLLVLLLFVVRLVMLEERLINLLRGEL